MIYFLKLPVYLTLLFLAFACIQAAHATKSAQHIGCKCKNAGLIMMIISCATIMLAVHYESFIWLMIAIAPLSAGSALWLLTSSAEMHHQFDKWLTQAKMRFKETFGRNERDDEGAVEQ